MVTLTPRRTAFRPEYMHQAPDEVLVLMVFGANIELNGSVTRRLVHVGIWLFYTACRCVASIISHVVFTIHSWKMWLGTVDDYHIHTHLSLSNY